MSEENTPEEEPKRMGFRQAIKEDKPYALGEAVRLGFTAMEYPIMGAAIGQATETAARAMSGGDPAGGARMMADLAFPQHPGVGQAVERGIRAAGSVGRRVKHFFTGHEEGRR
jgi:hypothetical protein